MLSNAHSHASPAPFVSYGGFGRPMCSVSVSIQTYPGVDLGALLYDPLRSRGGVARKSLQLEFDDDSKILEDAVGGFCCPFNLHGSSLSEGGIECGRRSCHKEGRLELGHLFQ